VPEGLQGFEVDVADAVVVFFFGEASHECDEVWLCCWVVFGDFGDGVG
jgi:hypothetical protein